MSHVDSGTGPVGTDHLLDVWELLSDDTLAFDAKLSRLFERETEALDLPYGFLTRIDRAADRQTIESARGSHSALRDGETAPLSESYCRKTIRTSDGVLAVDDAREEGWATDPAYDRFGLGTYLGATVGGPERPYGTLCFASSEPRETPITDSERRLLKVLARWVHDALRTWISCDCGRRLPVSTETDGELMSIVTCESCESEYAVTVSRLGPLSETL